MESAAPVDVFKAARRNDVLLHHPYESFATSVQAFLEQAAADPNVLLMDEPFGAVDPIVRAELQQELNRLQRELGKTIVFVTHDIDEAFLLADQVVILKTGGVVAQVGTPGQILSEPADDFVASFIGADAGKRQLYLQHRQGDGDVTLVVDGDGRPTGVLAGSPAAPGAEPR